MGIFTLNKDLNFEYTNENVNVLFGYGESFYDFFDYEKRSLKNKNLFNFIKGNYHTGIKKAINSLSKEKPVSKPQEVEIVTINGKSKYVQVSFAKITDEIGSSKYIGEIIDVTEEKAIREKIKESEEKFRTLAETAKDIIFIINASSRYILYANIEGLKISGYSKKRLFSQRIEDVIETSNISSFTLSEGAAFEGFIKTKRNKKIPVEIIASDLNYANISAVLLICRDISELEKLKKERERLYNILFTIRKVNHLLVISEDESKLYKEICKILYGIDFVSKVLLCLVNENGKQVKSVVCGEEKHGSDSSNLELLLGKNLLERMLNEAKPVVLNDIKKVEEIEYFKKEAEKLNINSALFIPLVYNKKPFGMLGILSQEESPFGYEEFEFFKEVSGDISVGIRKIRNEKEKNEALVREKEALKLSEALRGATLILMSKENLNEILDSILDISLELVDQAVSGNIAILEGDNLINVKTKGYEKFKSVEYVKNFIMNVNDFPNCKKSIKDKKPQIVYNTKSDSIWKHDDQLSWIKSNLSVPLLVKGKVYGLIRLDSDKENAFSKKDANKLIPLAGAAAIAVENAKLLSDLKNELLLREKTEKKLLESRIRIQENLDKFIYAISKIVEVKDAYTADHQKQVSIMAEKIARKLRLSEKEIYLIKISGLLHDLGKIYVPSEILSKPAKLTEAEYEIVKTHSEIAYNILKNIPMLEGVAKIILQHHERLNGTGYPYGISDDDICLGARILAVVDVFDAMVSHRPYRPARGFEVAIDELEKNKSRLYDCEVVDAFVELLKEGKVSKYWK